MYGEGGSMRFSPNYFNGDLFQMTPASNQLDDDYAFRHNASEKQHSLSFDDYFESTGEYDLLLTLHTVVPPTLVCFNCIGTAFTLARS